MSNLLKPILSLTYNQLGAFSSLENFWNLFDTAFGTQYYRTIAATMRSQWQVGDFSQLPEVEVIGSDILGNANGAYASSTNKIYLSDSFVVTATPALVSTVMLEEIGHFVDVQINQKDTPGDEGELFSALVQKQSLTNQDLSRISIENDWTTITVAGQTIAVEQAALTFNITFNDPSGKFSPYYSAIQSNILAAGSYWDNYIEGNASLEVLVDFSNSGATATGRSFTSSFVRNNGTFDVFEQGATTEVRTGIDPNGVDPDIEFNFNSNYLTNELWFDPNPSARITPVPNDKTDALSVLLHEFGHAFAFNGWRDGFNGTLPGDYESTFDEQTIFDGTNFFFVGSQATSFYGSPVPLTFGNITHVGNNLPRPGSNLISDLMNGVVYYTGTRYSISSLDLAILKDSGVPIGVTSITLAVNPASINEDGSSNNVIVNPASVNEDGRSNNDLLNGEDGNDVLNGGSGNDILIGVWPGSLLSPGLDETDKLTSGIGVDKFVFENATNVFYNDSNNSNADLTDYLLIEDFNSSQDKIQLEGAASGYLHRSSAGSGVSGTPIYLDTNHNLAFNSTDELIAIVQDCTLMSSYS